MSAISSARSLPHEVGHHSSRRTPRGRTASTLRFPSGRPPRPPRRLHGGGPARQRAGGCALAGPRWPLARRAGSAGCPGGLRRPRRRDAGGFGGSGAGLPPLRRGPGVAARSPRSQRCSFPLAVGPDRSRRRPRRPGWRTPRAGHPASKPPGGASPLTPTRSSSAEGQYSKPRRGRLARPRILRAPTGRASVPGGHRLPHLFRGIRIAAIGWHPYPPAAHHRRRTAGGAAARTHGCPARSPG